MGWKCAPARRQAIIMKVCEWNNSGVWCVAVLDAAPVIQDARLWAREEGPPAYLVITHTDILADKTIHRVTTTHNRRRFLSKKDPIAPPRATAIQPYAHQQGQRVRTPPAVQHRVASKGAQRIPRLHKLCRFVCTLRVRIRGREGHRLNWGFTHGKTEQ